MDAAVTKGLNKAVEALKQGALIAYPTEAVYGVGCDPKQPDALEKLISLKKRDPSKGLILIASSFTQLESYLADIEQQDATYAKKTWPGPVTWVWPVNNIKQIPVLLTGKHQTIAVRVTNHPIASALCQRFQGPIVSTSANVEGGIPARTAQQVTDIFSNKIDVIIDGRVGELDEPTKMYDVLTRKTLR